MKYILLAIVSTGMIMWSSCITPDRQFGPVKVYKFSKIRRLPDSLVKDSASLTSMEKEKLKEILQKRGQTFFVDNKGDVYLEKDPVQNDIMGQFWVLSDQIYTIQEDSIK